MPAFGKTLCGFRTVEALVLVLKQPALLKGEVWAVCSRLCSFARAAVATPHGPGDLNNRNVFSQVLETGSPVSNVSRVGGC